MLVENDAVRGVKVLAELEVLLQGFREVTLVVREAVVDVTHECVEVGIACRGSPNPVPGDRTKVVGVAYMSDIIR